MFSRVDTMGEDLVDGPTLDLGAFDLGGGGFDPFADLGPPPDFPDPTALPPVDLGGAVTDPNLLPQLPLIVGPPPSYVDVLGSTQPGALPASVTSWVPWPAHEGLRAAKHAFEIETPLTPFSGPTAASLGRSSERTNGWHSVASTQAITLKHSGDATLKPSKRLVSKQATNLSRLSGAAGRRRKPPPIRSF